MKHGIVIFNPHETGQIDREALLDSIKGSSFKTLCEQYGLDTSLIEPALQHLDLILPTGENTPFFQLKYQASDRPPIMVYCWPAGSQSGRWLLKRGLSNAPNRQIKASLEVIKQVFVIEITTSQLEDLGLLLAYELARWVASQGNGILVGLDGKWYRLNRHQAFIPIKSG